MDKSKSTGIVVIFSTKPLPMFFFLEKQHFQETEKIVTSHISIV